MKRRTFNKALAVTAAGMSTAGLQAFPRTIRGVSPNEKMRVGVIGAKGMGWANVNSLLKMSEVDLIGICDVDQGVIADRLSDYAELRDNSVQAYGDYRRMLEDKDIDIVVIGTPDHWHCRMMVDAVESGKHVYVEKPLANSIEEARIMERAAANAEVVVQVGQWQRSGEHYRNAIDIVRSGQLGNIRLVKVWAYQGWMKPVPVLPDGPAPEGVDYDMWLGPAPKRPFNPNRFHFNFRWFWDYAGGLMTDWGVHEIDIALYAMQARDPKSVIASGGKFAYPDDASETPDTLQAVFQYDNFNMLWEHATGINEGNYGKTEGIAFIGNNGTLVLNRQGFDVLVEYDNGDSRMELIESQKTKGNYLDAHTRNFVQCIRDNAPDKAACTPYSGSVAAVNAHMGNISYKLGRRIDWDAKKGAFIKDKEANAMLTPKYHNGWKLPG